MTNPTIGFWVSEDGEFVQPDPSNLYRYVGNNPTNLIDPSGLFGVGAADMPKAPTEQRPVKILGGTDVPLQNPTFQFNEGGVKGTGTVSLQKQVKLELLLDPKKGQTTEHWFAISVKTSFKMDDTWHWVQLFKM